MTTTIYYDLFALLGILCFAGFIMFIFGKIMSLFDRVTELEDDVEEIKSKGKKE